MHGISKKNSGLQEIHSYYTKHTPSSMISGNKDACFQHALKLI